MLLAIWRPTTEKTCRASGQAEAHEPAQERCLRAHLTHMQVFYSAGGDELSFMSYDRQEAEQSQGSYLHDVSEVESHGSWVRFR